METRNREEGAASPEDMNCARCDGCGQIADSDDGEPWSAWTSLPLAAQVAVEFGLVRPIDCPSCGGTGRRPAADDRREAEIASTVAAVEGGNLAEGITIPRAEPQRQSDDERDTKAEPVRLKIYQIQFDGEPESVVLLGDGPVLRSAVDWGLLDLLVELKRAAHATPQILPAIEAVQRWLRKAVRS